MENHPTWAEFAAANPLWGGLMAACTLFTGFGVIQAVLGALEIHGEPAGNLAKSVWAIAFGGLMVFNARRTLAKAASRDDVPEGG